MASIFEKFNKNIDLDGLKADVNEAKNNGGLGEFKEVPLGDYEIGIEKLELKESKKGDPMVSVWFNILEGEFKNSKLFMNQVLTQGFQIHIMNEFLKSLGTDVEITFDDFTQYNNMLMDIMEKIDGKFEYALKYSENKKGYPTYSIKEIYELED